MNFLKLHIGAFIYVFIICLLSVGVFAYTGTSHLDKLIVVFSSFVIFYWPLNTFIQNRFNKSLRTLNLKFLNEEKSLLLLFGVCILLFLIDIAYNNGLPGFSIFSTSTVEEVTSLRSNIHINSPSWVVYLSGFSIKCFFPFAILLFCVRKHFLYFTILLIIGSFYSFGMLQKSFIVVMLLPTFLYLIISKKYLLSFLLVFIMGSTISTIIIGSSDKIETTHAKKNLDDQDLILNSKDDRPFALRILIGMSHRIFIVPGEMVGEWFNIIPSQKPFLWGDGYPVLPRLMGHEYVDYDAELYPIIRPEYAKKGYTGTVNTATFMREYSNFGYFGLILSSLFVSIYIVILNISFRNNLTLFISINLMYLLLLSSSNLWTLMFSGGWLLTVILFIIFKNYFSNYDQIARHEK